MGRIEELKEERRKLTNEIKRLEEEAKKRGKWNALRFRPVPNQAKQKR